VKRTVRILFLIAVPALLSFMWCHGARSASPQELLDFKAGPLNQCKPYDVTSIVEMLAILHGRYVKGENVTLPRVIISTPSGSYNGFVLHYGQPGEEKIVVMATVPEGERFPIPGVAYIRVNAIQSIAFTNGAEAAAAMK